jgi:hypothetical protein
MNSGLFPLFWAVFPGAAPLGHFPDGVNRRFIIDIGLSGMSFGLNFGGSEPSHCRLWVNSEQFGDFSYSKAIHNKSIGKKSKNVKKYGKRLLTNLERYGTMLFIRGDRTMEYWKDRIWDHLEAGAKSRMWELIMREFERQFALEGYTLIGWRFGINRQIYSGVLTVYYERPKRLSIYRRTFIEIGNRYEPVSDPPDLMRLSRAEGEKELEEAVRLDKGKGVYLKPVAEKKGQIEFTRSVGTEEILKQGA